MVPHAWWLLAENSWHVNVFGGRTLGIAVWAGLATLTIALLILMRTRWGQVKPLSKCVVLSVFAHVLLLVYAYGTRLFENQPPVDADKVIHLAFVAADQPPREGKEEPDDKPWEQFVQGKTESPDTVEPDRADVAASQVTREARPEIQPTDTDVVPLEELPTAEPTRPTPKPHVRDPAPPTRSQVSAAAIDVPKTRQRDDKPPLVPDPIGPARIQPAPTISRRSADRASQTKLPSEVADVGSQLQKLADIESRSETADALSGRIDQLDESENRGVSNSVGIARPEIRSDADESLVALPPRTKKAPRVATDAPRTVEQVVARPSRRLGDGQPVPEPYRLRSTPQRALVAAELGGSAQAAAAVETALAWLAAQQERDGRWDADRWGAGMEHQVAGHDREGAGTSADTGITGLAILAFLANGQSHLEGKYRKNVQHGLEFLLKSQAADGNLAGQARLYASMYCHGMASLALSEALALTGDVRITPYVKRAVQYTVDAQHPVSGGWRYQPNDQGDMSQFGWQVMALKSAMIAGIAIPQETREGMLHFLQRCEQGRHGGLAGYRPAAPASRAMTAEALVCRYFLDLAPSEALVAEATDFMAGELPQPGTANLYYWYYGTLAMFQVQGPPWVRWNQAMQKELLRIQRSDGHLAGSWDPNTVWGSYGGRVYSTAMATLCLEVYYRYLPLTARRDEGQPVREAHRYFHSSPGSLQIRY